MEITVEGIGWFGSKQLVLSGSKCVGEKNVRPTGFWNLDPLCSLLYSLGIAWSAVASPVSLISEDFRFFSPLFSKEYINLTEVLNIACCLEALGV